MTEAEINNHIALLQQELVKYPVAEQKTLPPREQVYAFKYLRGLNREIAILQAMLPG